MKNKNFLEDIENGHKFSGYARVLKKRDFGKLAFWKVRFCEDEVQLLIQKNLTDNFKQIKKVSLGSLIFLKGEKTVTKKGEPSIIASLIRIEKDGNETLRNKLSGINYLGKSGNRILDMIANKPLFDYLSLLSQLTDAVRQFLKSKGFREFNTGILQEYFEGGQAEPFQTRCKVNGKHLYLSLTSELKLKRLMVAGFEKVYEVSQSFRNEGIDKMHLPEFTLLELYAVNYDYWDMMQLLEQMVFSVLNETIGKSSLSNNGNNVCFKPPFIRKTFNEACIEFLGIEANECTSIWLAKKNPGIFSCNMDEFTWIMKLVDKIFAPNFTEPTFLIDIPSGISPFAKKHSQDEKLSESAFFIAMGVNVATISTDENDEDKVAFLLSEQSKKIGRPINKDYLNILNFGLPQTAGIGFGFNRFHMLFQEGKKSARETCLLPIF
ncbi:amino acid--tRNA ligase-related protein [Desulfonauticus submarinus]